MLAPEYKVADLLAADKPLMALLDKIRGQPLHDPPVYSETPDFTNYTGKQIVAMSPWIRVTPVPGDEAAYADDQRIAAFPKLQVDVWVIKRLVADQFDIEDLIYNTMHKAGWERYYRASVIDADTPSLRMLTFLFQYQGLPLG